MRDFMPEGRRTLALCAGVLFCAFTLIYLPDLGHGFVSDDFGWIAQSSVRSVHDAIALFRTAPSGFFRPMVSLSFAANRHICGLDSRCYGMTNFCLAIGCAIGVGLLARRLALRAGAALFASALWIFNWHGINMAVLWISGRTALVFTLFAAFGVLAVLGRRSVLGVVLIACAIFSREEGVLLPVILGAWLLVDGRIRRDWRNVGRVLPVVVCTLAIDALYLLLRSHSGALTAATAPEWYRFSFTVARLAANLPDYIDRSATASVAVLLLFLLAGRVRVRTLPPAAASAAAFGIIWWIGGFAITIFLPGRSSLYACFPSVGVALMAATMASLAWDGIPKPRQRQLVLAGLTLPFLLWPVYHSRNRTAVREADLSRRTLAELQRIASTRGAGTPVVLEDDPSERPSLDNSFSGGIQLAADLLISPPIRVRIAEAMETGAPPAFPGLPRREVRLVLSNGALTEEPDR
jgi:hypothetical protein